MVLLVLAGYAIGLIVGILIVVDAYKQGGALHMCLCLFIPFYSLYWLLFKMENRGTMIIALIVSAMMTAAPALQTRYVSGGGGGGDDCSLLTAEQVASELDGTFSPGEVYRAGSTKGCQYRRTTNPAQRLLVGGVPCNTGGRLADMATGRNDFTVHEVGDEAVYADGVLVARKGSVCYAMAVEGIDPDSTLSRRKNLMRTMLAAVK